MEITKRQIFQAAGVLLVFLVISFLIIGNKPENKTKPVAAPKPLAVETEAISLTNHQFIIDSFGSAQPKTQSLLVSQVTGEITEVGSGFDDGGYFSKGDTLVQIDPRDYQVNVTLAESELLQNQLALAEEQARANQALIDWQRLSNGDKAPSLVLRKPQLAAAQAKVESAKSNLEKNKLDLQRTQIKAPYDGRIKNKKVDIGQFVNANTQLAEIFATDAIEVRLPIKNSELAFINLPGNFQNKTVSQSYPKVKIISELGKPQTWDGKIVRTEAAIDATSNQLNVVARIENPFIADAQHYSPLKIGQYVKAQIEGIKLTDVIVIPNRSIYQGSYVYLLHDGLIQRRNITTAFQTSEKSLVTEGLQAGDQLITSTLGQIPSGTPGRSITDNQATLPNPVNDL